MSKKSKIKLSGYIKPYWKHALLAPAGMAVEALLELQLPALMAVIVDDGVLKGDMAVITSSALKMILILIISVGGGFLAAYAATFTAQSFSADLRDDLYARVMLLPISATDKFKTGSLVTRLTNDVNVMKDFVNMVLRMFVRAPIQFFGGIVMMLSLNVKFGIIMVCALPIQIIIVVIIAKKSNPLYAKTQKNIDTVNAVVQENVSGMRVVKAYVREKYEKNRFKNANYGLAASQYKVQTTVAAMGPLMMIIMNAAIVALIFISGREIEAGVMQVGQVMAGVSYLTQVLLSLMQIAMIFPNYSRATASSKRISEVLAEDIETSNGSARPKADPNIDFCDVSFAYRDAPGQFVLEDINLSVKNGETLAILGSTGSGKSSLIKLIPRFYDTTKGTVKINGIDVKDYELTALRDLVGFVPQKNELFSGTIEENLRWGNPDATQEEMETAAEIAQAHTYITGFSKGYHTVIGAKGTSLSGGQKQRLCIARALLKQPKILIMDDSTSALDLGTEARLQTSLKTALSDVTVITIAQRIASVKSADRIAVLDRGKIVGCATHNELLETCDVYRNIYDSQVRKGDDAL